MFRLYFKQIKHLALAVSTGLTLSACVGPNDIGLSQAQWKATNPADQQKMMHAYHIIHGNLVAQSKQSTHDTSANTIADNVSAPLNTAPPIQITFVKGLAAFPPNFTPLKSFQPLSINITPGRCMSSMLASLDGSQQTPLWICYVHNLVAIDPSMTDLNNAWGTLYMNINPLWHQGFSYTQVSTHGYAQLQQATIMIKASAPFTFIRPSQDDQIPFESSQTEHTMKTPTQMLLPVLTAPQQH